MLSGHGLGGEVGDGIRIRSEKLREHLDRGGYIRFLEGKTVEWFICGSR